MVKTSTQKTEDLVYLGGELICQKNTLTHKLQREEQKGQAKVIPAVSHFSSYNWIILEWRMQESEGQRHGTHKSDSYSLVNKIFSRDMTDHGSSSGSLLYC